MRARVRPHLSYANVMSAIALFVALGGGAYAATSLPDDSVGTRQLKDHAVKHRKLARRAVKADVVAPNSLRGAQIDESSLGKVPSAEHADGAALRAGQVTGAKVAADTLTGLDIKEVSLGKVPSAASAEFISDPVAAQLEQGNGRTVTAAATTQSGALGSSQSEDVVNSFGGHVAVVCHHGTASGNATEVVIHNDATAAGADLDAWVNGTAGINAYTGLNTYSIGPSSQKQVGLGSDPQQFVIQVAGPTVSYTTILSTDSADAADDQSSASCPWSATTSVAPAPAP